MPEPALPALDVLTLHHVSLVVRDLGRSVRFYADVLGLPQLPRPDFDFRGAWFAVGDRQLHLIVHDRPTFRARVEVDSRDVHFALRVRSLDAALARLRALGYDERAADPARRVKVQPQSVAGFAQLHLVDPDGHVIELNAERADG